MRPLPTVQVMSVFALMACADQQPTSPSAIAHTTARTALVNNEWQTWSITFLPADCTSGFKKGLVDVHMVSTTKSGRDGSTTIGEHLNVRLGRLTDDAGNEFVFGQNGKYEQVMQSDGTYHVDVTQRFKLISGNSAFNEFIDIVVRITWDGSQLVVSSVFMSRCRS